MRKRCSCRREIRDLGASGKLDGPLSQSGGRPLQTPLSCARPFVVGLCLGSRSCPPAPRPAEVTPTALIIFCFAPGLFSATNFQQSPWQRTGEEEVAAMEIPGPSGPAAPANFSGSRSPAGRVGERSRRESRAGLPGPAYALCRAGEGCSHGAWGPWDPHWTPLPNPDAGAWQVAKVGKRIPPIAGHTHT